MGSFRPSLPIWQNIHQDAGSICTTEPGASAPTAYLDDVRVRQRTRYRGLHDGHALIALGPTEVGWQYNALDSHCDALPDPAENLAILRGGWKQQLVVRSSSWGDRLVGEDLQYCSGGGEWEWLRRIQMHILFKALHFNLPCDLPSD